MDALVASGACDLPVAEEFQERTQAIRQPDTEGQRVHDERVTIRLSGGRLPRSPAVVAKRQSGPELVGERKEERRVGAVAREPVVAGRERQAAQEGQLGPPTIRALDEIDLGAKLAVARAAPSFSAHDAGVADAELRPPAETDPGQGAGYRIAVHVAVAGEQVARLHLHQALRHHRGRLGLIRTIGHHLRRLRARDAGPHLRHQHEEQGSHHSILVPFTSLLFSASECLDQALAARAGDTGPSASVRSTGSRWQVLLSGSTRSL